MAAQASSVITIDRIMPVGIMPQASRAWISALRKPTIQVATSPAVGASSWDYDNDGWRDIFVTSLGRDRLFRCTGKGTYEEVTSQAGVGGSETSWSSSTGFFDFDKDGDLDIAVTSFSATNVAILLNEGGATFQTPVSYGVGAFFYALPFDVIADDLDNDGNVDFIVANSTENRLTILGNQLAAGGRREPLHPCDHGHGQGDDLLHYSAAAIECRAVAFGVLGRSQFLEVVPGTEGRTARREHHAADVMIVRDGRKRIAERAQHVVGKGVVTRRAIQRQRADAAGGAMALYRRVVAEGAQLVGHDRIPRAGGRDRPVRSDFPQGLLGLHSDRTVETDDFSIEQLIINDVLYQSRKLLRMTQSSGERYLRSQLILHLL